MDRRELIRRLALREICDDYENADQIILPSIARALAPHGFTIERIEVVKAIADLVADGLARGFILSSFPPHETMLEGMPDIDVIEEDYRTYFLATSKGRQVHAADDLWWPFEVEP
jgi:hypothetical protein